MIPSTIHYCWFGKTPKNKLILDCIASWKKHCPDFEIKEWDEENFDIHAHPFTDRMYKEKRWAFVSDYARLAILEQHGGFYLDTDMFLVQSLSPLLENTCVLGEEAPGVISAGMIGAVANHPFITSCKTQYNNINQELTTIPRVLSKIYTFSADKENITVLPSHVFYPFDSYHIKEFHGQTLNKETLGVHMWNYSWGSPLNRFFKKIGIHKTGTRIVEILGIKQFLKKLLGLI